MDFIRQKISVCPRSPFGNHFSREGVRQPVKEKTWQRARGLSSNVLSEDRAVPRHKLPGGRLQFQLRKTFLTVRAAQHLNGLLAEVESLEVFKVERSPLEKGRLHWLRG